MSDLISRKAAIEALKEAFNPSITNFVKAKMAIDNLPPAQPEKHTENTRKTHACDLIERQAAIDAHYEYCNKHPDAGFPVWSLKILEDLPSAQPESIRCKDCLMHGVCRFEQGLGLDGFCSQAERRTDGVDS